MAKRVWLETMQPGKEEKLEMSPEELHYLTVTARGRTREKDKE